MSNDKTSVRSGPPYKKESRGFATDCWTWQRSLNVRDGYGQVTVDGRCRSAHRWMYEVEIGPIPEGLTLDHLCRNRDCVNPAHLEPVTHKENVLRGEAPSAKNARKAHCKHGHPFDEKNTARAPDGTRYCRSCKRNTWHRHKDRYNAQRRQTGEG